MIADRHPSRQGIQPEEWYTMQHDIYSLGVCLLEVGLWSSFVQWTSENEGAIPILNQALDISPDVMTMKNTNQRASIIKTHLTEIAAARLPSKMGDVYTNIVLSCLGCLDKDNDFLGSSAEDLVDEDGIQVGVKFIEKVIFQIQSISV